MVFLILGVELSKKSLKTKHDMVPISEFEINPEV